MRKRVYIVIASINKLDNLLTFSLQNKKFEIILIVIDEGERSVRKYNKRLLGDVARFYGPRERKRWFLERFKSNYKKYLSIIPKKCHAEISFGFLVAYEENPKLVIEIDDDVFSLHGQSLIESHMNNIFQDSGVTVRSKCKWYNTLENLHIPPNLFPRGHPYDESTRCKNYIFREIGDECVLNMGLWINNLDLDALTLLFYGSMNGRYTIHGKVKREKLIVDKGTYCAICSMNTSFRPEIIPAFYQLYMNIMGLDRFDDIWSGIFFKKVADHLNKKVCIGIPVVHHNKRPRDIFVDLKKELEGIIINEYLWKMVDEIIVEGEDYFDSYQSLTEELKLRVRKITNQLHRKLLLLQTEKMALWLKVVDKIS